MSSFASGHGDKAVQDRLRYRLSLEESRAAGFADLIRQLAIVYFLKKDKTY